MLPTSQAGPHTAGKPSTSGSQPSGTRNCEPFSVFFASVRGEVDDLDDQRLGSQCDPSFEFFQPSSEIPVDHFCYLRPVSAIRSGCRAGTESIAFLGLTRQQDRLSPFVGK
jgi:hypothetical protein